MTTTTYRHISTSTRPTRDDFSAAAECAYHGCHQPRTLQGTGFCAKHSGRVAATCDKLTALPERSDPPTLSDVLTRYIDLFVHRRNPNR